eukprot:5325655-Amphidinium_carterae.1
MTIVHLLLQEGKQALTWDVEYGFQCAICTVVVTSHACAQAIDRTSRHLPAFISGEWLGEQALIDQSLRRTMTVVSEDGLQAPAQTVQHIQLLLPISMWSCC